MLIELKDISVPEEVYLRQLYQYAMISGLDAITVVTKSGELKRLVISATGEVSAEE